MIIIYIPNSEGHLVKFKLSLFSESTRQN
jgi:hypothetical protein